LTSTDQPGGLSQEELTAYLERLREAEASEILVQAFTMLGTGAEVKLGRPDARLLIDSMAAVAQVVSNRVPEDLAKGMQNGVVQLQMAQVQAERQAAQQEGAQAEDVSGLSGERPAGQAEQTPPPTTGQRPTTAPQPGPGQQREQNMTDRLWIPGRDPGPPRPRP
jgi:hypothetical protein